eukprot:scaffold45369_cov30-Phaeocystis_antarctica.AAC.1
MRPGCPAPRSPAAAARRGVLAGRAAFGSRRSTRRKSCWRCPVSVRARVRVRVRARVMARVKAR